MSTSRIERVALPEISSRVVVIDWPQLEAFAPASMRGLRHKVRHKTGRGQVNRMLVAIESTAVETTKPSGKLWLKVHAAEKVFEAWVGAQRVEDWVHFNHSG